MRKIVYLLLVTAFTLFHSPGFTQSTTIYVKALDNNGMLLNGGSLAVGHVNQIEALSYSQGVSAVCPTQPCKASLTDYALMMSLNNAAIAARQLLLKGLHMISVDVYYNKSGASFDYYKIHMEDVEITSVQESGSSETPTFSLTFMPKKIAWQYTASKPDGSAGGTKKGGWDFGSNTEWVFF